MSKFLICNIFRKHRYTHTKGSVPIEGKERSDFLLYLSLSVITEVLNVESKLSEVEGFIINNCHFHALYHCKYDMFLILFCQTVTVLPHSF